MIYQPPFHGEKKYLVATRKNERFPYHWHKEIELLYCMSGSLNMIVEGERISAAAGSAIFVNSAEEHSFELAGDDTEVLVIEGGERLFGDSFRLFIENSCPERRIDLSGGDEWQGRVKALLAAVLEEKRGVPTPDGKWVIHGCLLQLFALLYRSLPFSPVTTEKQEKHLIYLKNIQPALDFVEHHFGEQISVGTAAAEASYERTSFCRVFRMATGVTFLQYLNTRRIDEAKSLLSGAQLTIQEIGERCGLPRAKSFSRVFRQYCGMTPSEYRKRSRV